MSTNPFFRILSNSTVDLGLLPGFLVRLLFWWLASRVTDPGQGVRFHGSWIQWGFIVALFLTSVGLWLGLIVTAQVEWHVGLLRAEDE